MIGRMGGRSRDGALLRQVLEISLINTKKYIFYADSNAIVSSKFEVGKKLSIW